MTDNPLELTISFTPQAIREHFELDGRYPAIVALNDITLGKIGFLARTRFECDEDLWDYYHNYVEEATKEILFH